LRKAHAEAEAADRAWKGLAEPPPYSILDIDEWRDAAEVLRAHIAVLGAAIRHLDGELERAQAETHRADEALRRADDARDAPFGAARRDREGWRRDLAELQRRAAGAGAQLTQIARDAKAEDLAARQAELRRLERQIAIGMQHTRFDASDLAQVQRRLKDAIAALGQDRDRLGRQLQERLRLRDAAAHAVERAFEGTPERATADARLRVAQAWVDTIRNENEIVSGLPRLVDGMGCGATPYPVRSTDPAHGARPPSGYGRRRFDIAMARLRRHPKANPKPSAAKRSRSLTPRLANSPGDARRALHRGCLRAQTTIDDADRTLKRRSLTAALPEGERIGARARSTPVAPGRRAPSGLNCPPSRSDRGRRPAVPHPRRRGQKRRSAAFVSGRLLGRRAPRPRIEAAQPPGLNRERVRTMRRGP
jgi:hypothetical protein